MQLITPVFEISGTKSQFWVDWFPCNSNYFSKKVIIFYRNSIIIVTSRSILSHLFIVPENINNPHGGHLLRSLTPLEFSFLGVLIIPLSYPFGRYWLIYSIFNFYLASRNSRRDIPLTKFKQKLKPRLVKRDVKKLFYSSFLKRTMRHLRVWKSRQAVVRKTKKMKTWRNWIKPMLNLAMMMHRVREKLNKGMYNVCGSILSVV